VTEPQFPFWAFITEMTGIPVAFVFLWLLVRRLRLVHPATWEKLGRPSLFIWAWPGSVIALLEALAANIRLSVLPFRAESFQLTDSGTVILMWLVRATVGLLAIFRLWSWWANN
jgi:hypothetical protein